MGLIIKNDDFFNSKEKYICHQCNSMSNRSAHLAQAVFSHYPWANIYSPRLGKKVPLSDELPGNIIIKGNGESERFVINLMGQLYPGSPKYPDSTTDGSLARERYFKEALTKIARIPDLDSIAFPYRIGCGAANGNWNKYFELLTKFSEETELLADVYIYKNE